MEIQPYIYFQGRCEEAIAFYCQTLGAEVLLKMHYKDAPADSAYPVPSDMANKVMHATLAIGETHVLMADNVPSAESNSYSGFSLSITVNDIATAEKYFDALSQGGKVSMPFQKTFWTPGFGMLTDKFGIPWMINVRREAA